MKKIKFFGMAFALTLSLAACSSDDNKSVNSAEIAAIKNTIQSGKWQVTVYQDGPDIETNNFSGYQFNFNSNGVLTAVLEDSTITGSWSVTDSNDDDDDDSPSNDIDFNIAFAAPANFAELTEDWEVIQYTNTKIELIHTSGGNGGIDYLTFQKD